MSPVVWLPTLRGYALSPFSRKKYKPTLQPVKKKQQAGEPFLLSVLGSIPGSGRDILFPSVYSYMATQLSGCLENLAQA
jgi:hypothetical protein